MMACCLHITQPLVKLMLACGHLDHCSFTTVFIQKDNEFENVVYYIFASASKHLLKLQYINLVFEYLITYQNIVIYASVVFWAPYTLRNYHNRHQVQGIGNILHKHKTLACNYSFMPELQWVSNLSTIKVRPWMGNYIIQKTRNVISYSSPNQT